MMLEPILSASAMREADRRTIEDYCIPGYTLMESAGREAARILLQHYGPPHRLRVCILCGKGNNGGDGLVVARQLYIHGATEVCVLHLGDEQTSSPDAARNLSLLRQLKEHDTEQRLHLIPYTEELSPEALDRIACEHVLVDALLGTGLRRELAGPIRMLVEWMNTRSSPKVAIDIPTGLDSDTGRVHGVAVQATHTITMGACKTGMLIHEGPDYCGTIHTVEIGIPPFILEAQAKEPGSAWKATDEAIRTWLPERTRQSHKYRVGLLLSIAGARGYTGAPEMAARAAARIGAGMVIAACPEEIYPVLATKFTEIVTVPVPQTEAGTIAPSAVETLRPHLDRARALLVGCGLGRHPETSQLVHRLLMETELSGVLDADGLFALVGRTDLLTHHAGGRWILTPHLGEFKRLSGVTNISPEEHLALVRQYAQEWNVVLLLKGFPAIVGTPDGQIFLNPTGNPGATSAGHGDVLAGICAGLLAQGLSPVQAAVAGIYIAGAAADRYRRMADYRTLLASDVIRALPSLLKERFR